MRMSPRRTAARPERGPSDESLRMSHEKPGAAVGCAAPGQCYQTCMRITSAHQLHQTTGSLVSRDVVVGRAKADVGREIIALAIGGEYVTRVLILEIPVLLENSTEILLAPLRM